MHPWATPHQVSYARSRETGGKLAGARPTRNWVEGKGFDEDCGGLHEKPHGKLCSGRSKSQPGLPAALAVPAYCWLQVPNPVLENWDSQARIPPPSDPQPRQRLSQRTKIQTLVSAWRGPAPTGQAQPQVPGPRSQSSDLKSDNTTAQIGNAEASGTQRSHNFLAGLQPSGGLK